MGEEAIKISLDGSMRVRALKSLRLQRPQGPPKNDSTRALGFSRACSAAQLPSISVCPCVSVCVLVPLLEEVAVAQRR